LVLIFQLTERFAVWHLMIFTVCVFLVAPTLPEHFLQARNTCAEWKRRGLSLQRVERFSECPGNVVYPPPPRQQCTRVGAVFHHVLP
jgi:hypothetical protein